MVKATTGVLAGLLVLLCGVGSAVAQTTLLRIDRVDTEAFPTVEAIAEVVWQIGSAPFTEDDFSVTQGGVELDVDVTPLPPEELSIMLALDTSLPQESLQRLQGGVAEFLLQAPSGVRIGVVDAGAPPSVVLAPTTSTDEALAAIASLRPSSTRATYDAVRLALDVLAEGESVRPVVALFTAGPDNASVTDFSTLSAQLDEEPLAVYLVELALDGGLSPSSVLLTQNQPGTAQVITSSDEIVGAFDQIVRGVSNQYRLTFTVNPDEMHTPVLRLSRDELTLEASIPLGEEAVLGEATAAPTDSAGEPATEEPTSPTVRATSESQMAAPDASPAPDGRRPLLLADDDAIGGPSTGLIVAAALLIVVLVLLLAARPRGRRDGLHADVYSDDR